MASMKKRIVPLFVVAVTLIVMVAGAFYLAEQRKPLPIARVLPGGPLAYVQAVDMEKKWSEFSATNFCQTLQSIDYISVMKKIGVDEPTIKLHQDLRDRLTSPELQKGLGLFFGKEVAWAMYPVNVDNIDIQNIMKAAASMALVTRLKPEVKFVDTLVTILAKSQKDVTVQEKEYLKKKYTVIGLKGSPMTIGFVRIKDLLVLGFGEEPVKAAMSVYYNRKPSLEQDGNYAAAQSQGWANADASGYANFKMFLGHIKAQLLKIAQNQKQDMAAVEKELDDRMKQLEAFQYVSFAGNLGKVSQMKVGIRFDPKALPAELRGLAACSPSENKTLAFAPKDALGYQWGTCNDFTYYWQELKKELKQSATESAAKEDGGDVFRMEQLLGINIEKDIIPTLGKEVGGYVSGVDLQGRFPMPQLLFFVQLADRSKAEDIMSKIGVRQSVLLGQVEDYDGTKLTYYSVPLLANVEPAYCFYNDYLLVATSRQVLKNAIDAGKDPTRALATNADFQRLDAAALTGKNNSVLLMNLKLIADKLSGLLEWGSGWLTEQAAKQEAFTTGTAKRIEDVKQSIKDNEVKISTLGDEVVSLEKKREDIKEKPEELVKAESEIERLQKFISTLEKAMEPQLEEEKQLLAVKNDPKLLLAPEGEKRLKETQDSIIKKQTKVKSLQAEQQAFVEQKKLLTTVNERRADMDGIIKGKKDQIEQTKADVVAQVEILTEMEQTMKQLADHRPLNLEQREVVINQLVKPLIKAVSYLKGFSSRMDFNESVLSVNSTLELE